MEAPTSRLPRDGHLLLEFNIPRMGLRANAVLLLPGCWTTCSANSPRASTDIVRTEADERNLSDTARRVEALIHRAQANNEKIICFVTGVPGAGKTLVGLNIATSHRDRTSTHAVFRGQRPAGGRAARTCTTFATRGCATVKSRPATGSSSSTKRSAPGRAGRPSSG